MENLVRCTNIIVECDTLNREKTNNIVFEFNVEKRKAGDLVSFIAEVFDSRNIPVKGLYSYGNVMVYESNVYTKKRIIETVEQEMANLKPGMKRKLTNNRTRVK